MHPTHILIAPVCACCSNPAELLPRDDLAGGLAVCPTSGQLYRPDGNGYVMTALPSIAPRLRRVERARIDLSRSGYA